MNIKIVAILFVVAVIVFWKSCVHETFPIDAETALTPYIASSSNDDVSTPNPCLGRDTCVYIYLAAWCPHCKDLMPYIQDMRNFWKDKSRPGLVVIVGNDKRPAIEAMAAQVGAPVFLDPNNVFLKRLKINFFPYYIVVDAKGKIIATRQGAMQWVNKEINGHLRR